MWMRVFAVVGMSGGFNVGTCNCDVWFTKEF